MARATARFLLAAFSLSLAACFAEHAAAQLICPPDTYVARSRGKLVCAKGRAPAPKTAQAPKAEPPRENSEKEAVETRTTIPCAEFNAKFSAFHRDYALKFGGQARRNDQLIARLRIVIDQQKTLRDSLRQEAFRARDIRVRRHLSSQANEAARDIAAKERQLEELRRQDAAQESKWKAAYRAKAAALLAGRPRGCPVAAAE